MTVYVFTSAAFNYIPKARLLFQSIRKHHPEWVLSLALGDELRPDFDLKSEPFDRILTIDELDIPNWRGWTFCHSIVELCTAIKPFALRHFLRRPDCDQGSLLRSRYRAVLPRRRHSSVLGGSEYCSDATSDQSGG